MNYNNGKIYSIRSHQTDKIYIGSTTQPLSKRLSSHKAHFRAYLDGKYHKITSYDIIEYGDAYIELLEDFPCETKDQLHKREGECIRAEPNCVNKAVAGRTRKEYREEHKDFYNTYNHSYYKDNRDKIKDQNKQYYKDNSEYVIKRQTSYTKDNIEKIKDYRKKYYEINADKIKARTKQNREQKKMEENVLT